MIFFSTTYTNYMSGIDIMVVVMKKMTRMMTKKMHLGTNGTLTQNALNFHPKADSPLLNSLWETRTPQSASTGKFCSILGRRWKITQPIQKGGNIYPLSWQGAY